MRRIGVDVGGTFTDLIFWDDAGGTTQVHKVASTPADPSEAMMVGIRELCDQSGIRPADVDMLFHGTTVATNIVIQHAGANVGLVTTEGFRDLLHIGRKKRPFNFSSYQDVPWQKYPLVRRRHRQVVRERVLAGGEVETPLDEEGARAAVQALKAAGVDAVAICLLFSFQNPEHEQRLRAIVEEEFPEAYVSVSSEVVPLYREYERFSTTALNAYIGPKVGSYVRRLSEAVAAEEIASDVHLMTSAGGVITSQGAAERPVSLLMSGPVAGLLAGREIGRASGQASVITLDVGGTSADIGVAPDGDLRMKHLLDTKIGDYDAMVPMVDLDTIGAGGGSIAYIDAGGMFRVGPRSAGANPGPACYGRGGTEPAVTDALVVLGWLRPENFLGGRMTIDPDAAANAIEQKIASRLGMTPEQAAMGIFQIISHAMIDAISLNSVQKGYDPRDFALVAEGGAGPLFTWHIAEQMNIPRVIVPRYPGIASAIGLLTTDMRYEFSATVWQRTSDLDLGKIAEEYERLAQSAVVRLGHDGLSGEQISVLCTADCRYVGQGYELRVPVPDGAVDEDWAAEMVERFEAAHERTYFTRFPGTDIQVVNLHVTGIGRVPRLKIQPIETGGEDPSAALKFVRHVLFLSGDRNVSPLSTGFYDRALLKAGNRVSGPAVIEQFDSTTIVGPEQIATVDPVGHLVITGGR